MVGDEPDDVLVPVDDRQMMNAPRSICRRAIASVSPIRSVSTTSVIRSSTVVIAIGALYQLEALPACRWRRRGELARFLVIGYLVS